MQLGWSGGHVTERCRHVRGEGRRLRSPQDRFCLNDNARFVRWVSLDVLIEKIVEKY